MNGSSWAVSDLWLGVGWTMVHYLWVGTLWGLLAMVCRRALRRASADTQYVVGLGWLALLAVTPLAIAAWIAAQSPAGDLPTVIASDVRNIASAAPGEPRADIAPGDRTSQNGPESPPNRATGVSQPPVAVAGSAFHDAPVASGGSGGDSDWSKVIMLLPWIWLIGAWEPSLGASRAWREPNGCEDNRSRLGRSACSGPVSGLPGPWTSRERLPSACVGASVLRFWWGFCGRPFFCRHR